MKVKLNMIFLYIWSIRCEERMCYYGFKGSSFGMSLSPWDPSHAHGRITSATPNRNIKITQKAKYPLPPHFNSPHVYWRLEVLWHCLTANLVNSVQVNSGAFFPFGLICLGWCEISQTGSCSGSKWTLLGIARRWKYTGSYYTSDSRVGLFQRNYIFGVCGIA